MVAFARGWLHSIAAQMPTLRKVGRLLFFLPIACFGLQHIFYAATVGPSLTPPWIPFNRALVALLGALLLFGGVGLFTRYAGWSAGLLAIVFLIPIVLFYVREIIQHPRDLILFALCFELLCMSAGALMLMQSSDHAVHSAMALAVPRIILGVALLEFGAQHFVFLKPFSKLVPAWMPGHAALTIFVGCALIAAGLALLTNVQVRLAATLLGVMFLIFVVTLHIPRILHAPHSADEWTSGLVAVAMSGISWITASTSGKTIFHRASELAAATF